MANRSLRVTRPMWAQDGLPPQARRNILEVRCPNCGCEYRTAVEHVDGGEAEVWREKYQRLVKSLDGISAEIDEWFDVNPWREQARIMKDRIERLIRDIERDKKDS